MKKLVLALVVICFIAVGCNNKEAKKETKVAVKTETSKNISFNISGMTCKVGCAKAIASKLSKKEGVLDAEVIFEDGIAKVKYDASKTNKKDLMAFVEGVGNGNMYKTSNVKTAGHNSSCSPTCKGNH